MGVTVTDATKSIVTWESHRNTVAILSALYVSNIIFSWLSLPMVVFLLGNLLFIGPITMKKKGDVIKAKINPVLQKALRKSYELLDKVPKYTDVVAKKVE